MRAITNSVACVFWSSETLWQMGHADISNQRLLSRCGNQTRQSQHLTSPASPSSPHASPFLTSCQRCICTCTVYTQSQIPKHTRDTAGYSILCTIGALWPSPALDSLIVFLFPLYFTVTLLYLLATLSVYHFINDGSPARRVSARALSVPPSMCLRASPVFMSVALALSTCLRMSVRLSLNSWLSS